MKSIVYAGAALMIGASIYGFVDYKKTSQRKEFQLLYTGKEKTKTVDPVQVTSMSEKDEKAIDESLPNPVAETKTTEIRKNPETGKKTNPLKEKKRDRKLNYKKFSRAALEREFVEPEKK
jgi:hypothetical protein